MSSFREEDVQIIQTKLVDGRRFIQLVHRPTGLFAQGYATTEPLLDLKNRLFAELRGKVCAEEKDEKGTQLES